MHRTEGQDDPFGPGQWDQHVDRLDEESHGVGSGMAGSTATMDDDDRRPGDEAGASTASEDSGHGYRLRGIGHALGKRAAVAAREPSGPLQARHPHAGRRNGGRDGLEAAIGELGTPQ